METPVRALLLAAATLLAAVPLSSTLAAAKTQVTILTVGYPDEDTTDAVAGATAPGIKHLVDAFAAANPDIDLQVTNIPWGSGATGYAAEDRGDDEGEPGLFSMRCPALPASPGAACWSI